MTALENAKLGDISCEIQTNLGRGFQPECNSLSRDLMEPISTGAETLVPRSIATDKTAITNAEFSLPKGVPSTAIPLLPVKPPKPRVPRKPMKLSE